MRGNRSKQFEPVTVVYNWQVKKGQEEAFRKWIHDIASEAVSFPGHLGVTTLHQPDSKNIFHSVLRFDSYQHLEAWLSSKERANLIKRLDGIATEKKYKLSGFENWLEMPGTLSVPRWKMVIATFIAVYPLSLILNEVITPHLAHDNIFVRALLFPVILPIVLTYILMPFITQRLLRRWLHK